MLYYAGDWLLRRGDGFECLLDSPYEVALGEWITVDRLGARGIIVAVPSEQDFETFTEYISTQLTLRYWHPASEAEFNRQKKFSDVWKNSPTGFLDFFILVSEQNEKLIALETDL